MIAIMIRPSAHAVQRSGHAQFVFADGMEVLAVCQEQVIIRGDEFLYAKANC